MTKIVRMAVIAALLVAAFSINGYAADPSKATGSVMSVSDKDFKFEVLEADVPVLAVFSADWCKYCKKLEPVLDEIAAEYKGKVRVVVINIDRSPEASERYNVQPIPALFMHDQDGYVTSDAVGYMEKDYLLGLLGVDEVVAGTDYQDE